MVIYDLTCNNDHGFEGWFSGPENFQEQLSQGLVVCPVCNSTAVTKLPHACAVHTKQEERPAPPTQRQPQAMPPPEQLKEALIRVHHYIENNFENVGHHFADEARRIHAGETEERPIHGTATAEQREALDDDSVPYMMLPKPELDG
ncbi:MAG: DUF1178 family protein [Deltaproteobacteria bacterium]|nr:DUF1178 family protein [Deltaproteobacteria bacterium]